MRNGSGPGLALLALLSLAAVSCGKTTLTFGPPGTGAARLVATCQGSACASIARVTVTVSKGDGADMTSIAADLSQSGAQWTGRISQIPIGSGRRFDATAYDASGAPLYTGFGKSDILAGATALISITLRPPLPPAVENAAPIVDSLSSARDVVPPNATVQVNVWAHDPNTGDTLTTFWRSTCGSFDEATKPAPIWTAPGTEGTCQLSVTVADNHGASVTASITLTVTTAVGDATVTAVMVDWPVISSLGGSITLGTTMQGDLAVVASSPSGDPLAYAWSSTCPGLTFDLQIPHSATAPHFSLPGPSAACAITVTVTAVSTPPAPAGTTGTLYLPPNQGIGSKCQNVTCQAGQACDWTSGLCKPSGNPCAAVSCPAADACHQAGVCDPTTGACSYAPKSDGTACDDGKACTTNDVCTAGVCGGTVSCPSGQACDATGQCAGGVDPCAGVTCNTPPPCHVAGTCSNGTCSYPAATDGTTCDDGKTCTTNDVCTAGVCAGTVSCPSGQACDATGQCATSAVAVPRPQVAKALAISPLAGVAMDLSGATYVAGSVFQPAKTFDAFTVNSAGGADLLLAKYDPVSHAAVWAKAYGDASDQLAAGAAVTADGTLVGLGNFIGTIQLPVSAGAAPTISNASQSPIDFLVAVNASNGNGKWAKAFDDGLGGALIAVAANPSLNLVAVCGYANKAATALVPGATFGGGSQDAVIAVFTSAGTLVWSKQLGGANEEECDSVAIDDAGDVYAAGKYDGAFNPGLGALPSPASSFRRWIWVAKYNGTTGAAISQASFGTGAGVHTPKRLAVDATGKLVVAGTFTATLTFGSTSLTSAGATDAFVAKLDPSAATALSPVWAVRLGGSAADEARGLATDSLGDVLVVGLVNGTTTGAAALTAASSAASDAFVLKLDGGTGATQFAAVYGDAQSQDADHVAVDRSGTGSVKDLVVYGGGFVSVIDFGAPAGSLATTGVNDSQAFLVLANLLP